MHAPKNHEKTNASIPQLRSGLRKSSIRALVPKLKVTMPPQPCTNQHLGHRTASRRRPKRRRRTWLPICLPYEATTIVRISIRSGRHGARRCNSFRPSGNVARRGVCRTPTLGACLFGLLPFTGLARLPGLLRLDFIYLFRGGCILRTGGCSFDSLNKIRKPRARIRIQVSPILGPRHCRQLTAH